MFCRSLTGGAVVMSLLVVSVAGCGGSQASEKTKSVIRVEGSDTMVNLAQAWAEQYNQQFPGVEIQVSGGGSGVGIASLINGVCDMADASREMSEKEFKAVEDNNGRKAVEFAVARDALSVYVHKDNPTDTISLAELAEVYGEGGQITKWSQLGVNFHGCTSGQITRVSRQNNSGTYVYFREAVLGKRDFKLGSIDQSGSKDVVSLVASTPCAIGYSGMGYATDHVKMLKVSKKKGEPGVAPTVANAKSGTYPLSRALYIYTAGEPTGAAKQYLDWIMSDAGQKVVLELGFVPVTDVAGN